MRYLPLKIWLRGLLSHEVSYQMPSVRHAPFCCLTWPAALRRSLYLVSVGVVLDSDRPHLIGIDDDLTSTGITLYQLKVRHHPLPAEGKAPPSTS